MPFKSQKQEAFMNANKSKMESQGVDVDEFNQASKGKKLPVKKSAPMPRGSGKPLINLQGMMNDGSA